MSCRTAKSLPWRPRNEDDIERLKRIAKRNDRSDSAQIRRYVREGMERDEARIAAGEGNDS